MAKKRLGGGSWTLRNSKGNVLLHSRRAFLNLANKEKTKLHSLLWAIDCMKHHHVERVVFASHDRELVEAILRLKAWPSFKFQASQMLQSLS